MTNFSFFKNLFQKFGKNWFVILTLSVAVVGGIPGMLTIYERLTDLPDVLISIRRIDFGEVNWPETTAQNPKRYILFALTALNEEKHPIAIPLKSFNMFIDLDGEWTKFDPVFIPSSGTALYKTSKHVRGANIDHADLQKYTELEVGRQHGHYNWKVIPEIMSTKRARFSKGEQYLLFLAKNMKTVDIKKIFEKVNPSDVPVRITWKNHSNEQHEVTVSLEENFSITSDCYWVAPKIKPFVYNPEEWN